MSIQWVALVTLLRREWGRIFRIWPQTLLPSVVTTGLYMMIFGHVVGDRIGPLHGVSYGTYIIPGLLMMSVITNSFSNTVFSLFGAKFQRFIEEMLGSPMHRGVLLAGFVWGGVCRGMMVGGLVWGIGWCWQPIPMAHPLLAVGSLLMAAILFSTLGFINALFATTFDDINLLNTFLLTPLTYLGGVFYSVSFLPPIWQTLSYLNPIFYLVNVLRYAMLGHADIGPYWALVYLGVVTLLVIGVSWGLMKRNIGLRM